MRASRNLLTSAVIYLAILYLFCFVFVYQVRSSLDTIHLQRNVEFFAPFLLDPFSNRVGARAYVSSWEQGNELLSVNGRPFQGMSMYLRELWNAQQKPVPVKLDAAWHPFFVTVRSAGSRTRVIEFGFPHRTCGIPSVFEAAAFWLISPLFCVLVGFAVVCARPRAMLAWAHLVLMLSLSQLQIWPDFYMSFQRTANPMVWSDWLRVPAVGYRAFVQHAWPAALLLAATHFQQPRKAAYRLLMALAAAFLVFAALQAALQISRSEDYRKLAFVYHAVEDHKTGLALIAVTGITIAAWLTHRRLGVAALSIALAAGAALFWGPSRITTGQWQKYSDGSFRFDPTIPLAHNTPELITLLYAAGCVLAVLIAARARLHLRDVAAVVFCVPLLVHVAGCWGGYWYITGPEQFRYWIWVAFPSAGLGLACATLSVLRRTAPATTI